MRMLKGILVTTLLLGGFAIGGAYYWAGRADGPEIDVRRTSGLIGRQSTLEVAVRAPGGRLQRLDIALQQQDTAMPLFTLPGDADVTLTQADEDEVVVSIPLARRDLDALAEGPAVIVVDAARPVVFGLLEAAATHRRELEVRLTPPRLAVLSSHHFVNLGGSEMVAYRVTPDDADSGVMVGDVRYPGYPASGAGVSGADPSVRVAFFALLHDQDLATPITLYARDAADNEARAPFDYRVFPRTFRRSRITVDDAFLSRVVPAILQNTRDWTARSPDDLLKAYLEVNGDLRRHNSAQIAQLAERTAPTILWEGPFTQLTNSQVESSFADHRTYFYGDEEIDRQVHLGFDLAVTANVPVEAANRGMVVFADYLGIYGNCVVIDHGMGLQSLYAHLSRIDVAPGTTVERQQAIGRSGVTGLAGGDHLHFTMLLGGHPVTPIDWWSAQWIQDRIVRKLQELVGGAPVT